MENRSEYSRKTSLISLSLIFYTNLTLDLAVKKTYKIKRELKYLSINDTLGNQTMNKSKWRQSMKHLLLAGFILFLSTTLQAETITLASGLAPKSKAYKAVESIMLEIGKKAKLDIQVKHYPRNRMFLLVKNESKDINGLAFALNGIDKKFKNLMKVPEVVLNQSIVAVGRIENDTKINGWKSLAGFKLAHVRGAKLMENNLKKVGLKAHLLDSPGQGLKFIKRKRADFFITTPLLISAALSAPDCTELKMMQPAIAKYPYYSYFFKSQGATAQKFQQGFKAIKADGTYDQILKKMK